MRHTNRRRATRLLGIAALAQLVLGANCATAHDDDFFARGFFSDEFKDYGRHFDSITLGHGNAVAHNIAVQTIDPWPRYVGRSRIDIDGERLLVGVNRYKANKSLKPKGLATESVSKERESNTRE